uniref:Uncharacterized protein n=1 Tax=Eubacterium cellulosolvens (strain ATCC 43171 / JCM 9499 / 6) TaxID=633697 RepID=I5ARD6_EUBC6
MKKLLYRVYRFAAILCVIATTASSTLVGCVNDSYAYVVSDSDLNQEGAVERMQNAVNALASNDAYPAEQSSENSSGIPAEETLTREEDGEPEPGIAGPTPGTEPAEENGNQPATDVSPEENGGNTTKSTNGNTNGNVDGDENREEMKDQPQDDPFSDTFKSRIANVNTATAGGYDLAAMLGESKAVTASVSSKIYACYVTYTSMKASNGEDVYEMMLDEVERGSADPAAHDNTVLDMYYYNYKNLDFWKEYEIIRAIYVPDRNGSMYFEGNKNTKNDKIYQKGTLIAGEKAVYYSRDLNGREAQGTSEYVTINKDLSIRMRSKKINPKDAEIIYVVQKKTASTSAPKPSTTGKPTPTPKPTATPKPTTGALKRTISGRLIKSVKLYTDHASDWEIQQDFRLYYDIHEDSIHSLSNSEVYGNDHTLTARSSPGYLIGAEVLQPSRKDKENSGNQAEITAAEDMYLTVALDTRVVNPPSWLQDGRWSVLSYHSSVLTVTDGGDNTVKYRLYRTRLKAGEKIMLGSIENGPAGGGYAQYVVFATKPKHNGLVIQALWVRDEANAYAWSVIDNEGMLAGDHFYGDRCAVFPKGRVLPSILQNTEFLSSACDSKNYGADSATLPEEARFTAGMDGTVYLAVDQRLFDQAAEPKANVSSWLNRDGWVYTGENMEVIDSIGADQTMFIYRRTVKKGELVILDANGNTSHETMNYLVFAKPGIDEGTSGDEPDTEPKADPSKITCQLYFYEGDDSNYQPIYSEITQDADGIFRRAETGESPVSFTVALNEIKELKLTIPSSYRYTRKMYAFGDDEYLEGVSASFSALKGTGSLRLRLTEEPPLVQGTRQYQTVNVVLELTKQKKYTVYYVDESAQYREFSDLQKNASDLIYYQESFYEDAGVRINLPLDSDSYTFYSARFLKGSSERQFYEFESWDPRNPPSRSKDDINNFSLKKANKEVSSVSFDNAKYDLNIIFYVVPKSVRYQVLYYYTDRSSYNTLSGSEKNYFAEESTASLLDVNTYGNFTDYATLSAESGSFFGQLVSCGEKNNIHLVLPEGYEYSESYMYVQKKNGLTEENFRYELEEGVQDRDNGVQDMAFRIQNAFPGIGSIARLVVSLKPKNKELDYSQSHVYIWYYDIENGKYLNGYGDHYQMVSPDRKKGNVVVPYRLVDSIMDDPSLSAKDYMLKEVQVMTLRSSESIPYTYYDKDKNSDNEIERKYKNIRFLMPKPLSADDTTRDNDVAVIFYVVNANGRVGYNLNLPDARWSQDGTADDYPLGHDENDMVSIQGVDQTDAGIRKLFYRRRFTDSEEIRIVQDHPVSDEYTFIGWFDKKRTMTKNGKQVVLSRPTIRKSGALFRYHTTSEYTLDALWARIDTDDKIVKFDGSAHTLDEANVSYSMGTLRKEYQDQMDEEGYVLSDVTYSKTMNGTYGDLSSVAEVQPGRYKIYMKATLSQKSRGTSGDEIAVYATSWLTINPVAPTGISGNRMPFGAMLALAVILQIIYLIRKRKKNETTDRENFIRAVVAGGFGAVEDEKGNCERRNAGGTIRNRVFGYGSFICRPVNRLLQKLWQRYTATSKKAASADPVLRNPLRNTGLRSISYLRSCFWSNSISKR